MSYVFNRKSIANCLVLQGFDRDKVKSKDLFLFSEKWMLDHGFEPNKIDGKGRKNISFSRGKKALEKEDFEYTKKKGFWMASLPSDELVTLEATDYKACISLRCSRETSKENLFFLSWDENYLSWEDSIFYKLVENLGDYFKPKYGYIFQRPLEFGPLYYAYGTVFGLDINEQVESKQIANWSWSGILNGRLSQPYFIRDVYRLNFLSRVHLDAPVGTSTLENWIKENNKRGTLEKVTSDLTCWSVNENIIDEVRQQLIPHKVLAAYVDY